MRRNSKSKKKGPASFVIGEEAIVDDAFRTEQPSGSNPIEGTAEVRLEPASPEGGADSPAVLRQRASAEPVDADPKYTFTPDEVSSSREFRETPTEDLALPPGPVARFGGAELSDEQLTYEPRTERKAPVPGRRPDLSESSEERLDGPPAGRGAERESAGFLGAYALPRFGEASSNVDDEELEEETAAEERGPKRLRPDERERRGVLVGAVVVLLIAAVALSGVLKGGGDESGGAGGGDRLAKLQEKRADRRADRRHDRLVERRQQRIAERQQERLAARRQERQEAQEVEQVEETPAPVETAPVTVPVPAPAPAPVTPAPAPSDSGDNIAGNEWGP